MDIWNIARIADRLEELDIAVDREATNIARWIWEDILGLDRQTNKALDPPEVHKLQMAMDRATKGEPIQYIAGHAWFYGYRFLVSRDVLIPRPETEELVEWILADYRHVDMPVLRILDIGTGSGCIAISLKKRLGEKVHVHAIDISEKALCVARHNSELLEADIEFHQRDFLAEGLGGLGEFDIIVSNPPYVSRALAGDAIVLNLRYEPPLALYAEGNDPDIFYKKISAEADGFLSPGGRCYLELNEFRAREIEDYFHEHGWTEVEMRIDMQGLPRILRVRR